MQLKPLGRFKNRSGNRKTPVAITLFATVSLIVPLESWAFGSDTKWTSGWGQGVAESIVTKGPGNKIYIACDGGSALGSSISFTLLGKRPTGSVITLTFDNEDPSDYSLWDGEIPADCRACASVFDLVIQQLKRHNSVHVRFENGDATRFTLKGSNEAIGECVPDFWR